MNTQRRLLRDARRAGISLFEVLIAILVAAIGVFGVILLIPFAWETAEKGIDRETAMNAANNYVSDFSAFGFNTAADTWYDDWGDDGIDNDGDTLIDALDLDGEPTPHIPTIDVGMPANNQPAFRMLQNSNGGLSTIASGWPYLIDPIGAANLGVGFYGQFPDTTSWPAALIPADFPTLNRTTMLEQATLTPLSVDLAARLSLYNDDLTFKKPANELGPPRQAYYSISSAGVGGGQIADIKRQYQGKYKTVSIVVPEDDEGYQYRMFVIVFKPGDREQSESRVFEVVDPTVGDWDKRIEKTDLLNDNIRENYNQTALGGGDLMLSELGTPTAPPLNDGDQIRNNDWMMLMNYHKPAGDTKTFDDIQLGFYQVIHSDRTSPTPSMPASGRSTRNGVGIPGAPERTYSVTVQGADFDLFRDWFIREDGVTPVNAGDRTFRGTYAILIPNVLVVYERIIRAEGNSTWNIISN